MSTTGRSTARRERHGGSAAVKTQQPANEYVQLAADLGGCLAFEPKKWRQVLAKSTAVLSNNSTPQQLNQSRIQASHVVVKKRPHAGTIDTSARPSSRDEDASSGVLPSVYPDQLRQQRPTMSLSEYLNQPDMVRSILEEAADEIQGNFIEDLELYDDDDGKLDKLSFGMAELSSSETTHKAWTLSQEPCDTIHQPKPALLPLLKTMSPRTRQGLARLPPPSVEDLQEIQEMEGFAENKRVSHNFYQLLKQQQLQHKRQTNRPHDQPSRQIQRTVSLGKLSHNPRLLNKPAITLPGKQKRKSPVKSGTRDEQIHMAMEDFNVNNLEIPVQSSQVRSVNGSKPAGQPSKHYEHLLHEQESAIVLEQVAQSHVDHTITEIRQFLPLEVIYAFGQGKFASPAQQRATEVLFRVGSRLKSNLLIQAVAQWRHVVADLNFQELSAASLTIQCWWRQVLAVQELHLRRRIRFELRKRQQALVRMLASKQNQSASVITSAIRDYVHRKNRHRVLIQTEAAATIQKFWRDRQAFWVALRIQLRKKQRLDAAVCIQKHARGRQARRKRRLLLKIRHVEEKMAARDRLKQERRRMLKHQGAVVLIQRAFRKWQQRQILTLRRRRAQFERDKVKIVKVQAQFRGQQARKFFIKHLLEVHNAVLLIQRAWRCAQARRVRRRLQDLKDEQRRRWREEIDERHRNTKKRLVIAPQQVKKTWNQLVNIKDRVIPGHTTTGNNNGPSPQEVHAAMKLQARWRGIKIRQRLRHEKAWQLEMQRRAVIKRRKRAAICIQKRVRGVQGRAFAWDRMVNRSAKRIQSSWRGFRTRRELIRMQKALLAIQKMQIQWRQRRSGEFQNLRHRAITKIQKRARVFLGKRWLRKMVARQQFLAEEQAMGKVLIEATRRRVKDELLLQSFVSKELHSCDNGDDDDVARRVDRSLFRLTKATWKRKGYDGVWQEVFRNASGGSTIGGTTSGSSTALEIDNSRFARFLKALPHSFINKTSFPTQTVDLIFTKMKEPKARTLSFSRFTKAMALVWQEKFAPGTAAKAEKALKSDPKAHEATAESVAADQFRYLRFMNQFVLPSTFGGGKYRNMLDEQCSQRVLWAVAVLRRFASRIAARKLHDHFLILHRVRLERQRLVKCANNIAICYRCYRFRCQMKTTLAQMFIEFVDHRGCSVRFKHMATGKVVTKRPVFLKGVACKKVIPLPFPGEEFHAFCERHEDSNSVTTGANRVAAQVYCVECEDAMCEVCFARDHDKRQAFQSHEQRRIPLCTHCLTETATRECLHCGNGHVPYCDACYPHVHRATKVEPTKSSKIKTDTHSPPPVVIPSKPLETHGFQALVVMCVECASRVAQWECESCQDVFCKRCLSAFHAKGQRQRHQCHRLSYFSVLKQLATENREANAQKQLEKRRKQREDERKQHELADKHRHGSAIKIQALVRSFVARQQGKKYMKLVRQTQAAKAQRLKDEKVRASILYKVKGVFGLSPALKSDTSQEIVMRRQRIESIKRTLFLHRRVSFTEDSDNGSVAKRKKKKWTKKKRVQVLEAANSWCVYGVRVKINVTGEWKNAIGFILSTQNLLHTGFVLVFISQANKSLVVNWEQIAPYDDDEFLRQPHEPQSTVLLNAAHDFHARLARVLEAAARKARLLYLQTVEFHDIVAYAWVVEFNKHEQKEEFWNVVLNKRTFEVPRAMEQIERMEIEQRQEVEARVALAKSKLMVLLHPFQPKNKPRLAVRRNALVVLSANQSLKKKPGSVNKGGFSEVDDQVDALACTRFWHDTVLVNEHFGGKRATKFLNACTNSPPHSTLACWVVLKLWMWMDLYEAADGFEPHAKTFLSLASDLQLYITSELKPLVMMGSEELYMQAARDKLLQLLKLKEETLQLLVFNAEQQRAAAEDATKA